MSWGVYWLFYQCPQCGKKFKSGADTITEPTFGMCPACPVSYTHLTLPTTPYV